MTRPRTEGRHPCRSVALLCTVVVIAVAHGPSAEASQQRPPRATRPLETILRELGRDSTTTAPVRIVWSSRVVRPELEARDPDPALPLPERLDALLAPLGLAAVEEPVNTWTVIRRDDPAAQATLVVSVVGRPSGRPVAEARLTAHGDEGSWTSRAERSTDADGSARFAGLPPGPATVEVRGPRPRFPSPERLTVQLLPGRETELTVELEEAPATSEEIVVTPSRSTLLGEDSAGALDLRRADIERLPHLGDDLFRAAARLPGAVADDFSATLGFRGGEAREVPLRVDGLEIPKPWHLPDLQNLFGIVDSAIVDSLDLYSGGFPVEFGNAQSGVLDTRTRAPTSPRLVELGVSFLTARALAGGAFDNGGGWLAAARRGYLDLVLRNLDIEDNLEPVYADLFAKLEKPLGRRTLVAFEVFALDDQERFSSDDPEEEALAGEARGVTVWLRLDTGWTDRLSSRTVLGWSRRSNRRSGFTNFGLGELDDRRESDDWTASQDWSWDLERRQSLKAGWIAVRSRAEYDLDSLHLIRDPILLRGGPPIEVQRTSRLSPSGTAAGAYLADRWSPFESLSLELGARFDSQSWTSQSQVSPRLQLAWQLGATQLRAAWGAFHQAQRVDELQVEDGVEEFHAAEEARHRILSLSRPIGSRGRLRIEGYDKVLPRPARRFENLFDPIQLFPSVEDDRVEVAPDRARVRGVEIAYAVRPSRRTSADLSYVWSKAEDRVEGRWAPRRFDQTHAATAILGLSPGDRWSVELVAVYHTGWPTTALSLVLAPGPDGTPVYGVELGPRNAERFPAYQRLDARVRRSQRMSKGVFDFYLEVFNLLDRDNVCCVNGFEVVPNGTEIPALRPELDTWLPLVPSFGVVWRHP